jgi:hypothetical protein
MDCRTFLARYSEFLDEADSPAELAALRMHVETCASCSRYDRVMRQGLALARAMPAVQPSEDFRFRLEHRLLHEHDASRGEARGVAGGAAVSLALAGLLAVAAFGPLLRWSGDGATPAAAGVLIADETAAADRARPAQRNIMAEPRVDWRAMLGEAALIPQFAPPEFTRALPGPYSPLIVTQPAVTYPAVHSVSSRPIE